MNQEIIAIVKRQVMIMNKEEPQIFTRWIDPTINEYKQQIDQLTSNWNELEKWLKDFKRLYEGNEFQNNAKFCITVDQALDKMKEIKNDTNN